jgi:hypothetical protein
VPPVNSTNAGSSECNWLPPDSQELLRAAGLRGSACTCCLPSGPELETTRNIVDVATALKAGGVAYLGFRRSPVRRWAPCSGLARGLARTEAVMRMGGMLGHRYTATAAAAARMQGALALFGGAERTWTDTALGTESSPGRGTLSAEAGGSGRGSSGEGNCSSLHMEMYLSIRVVSCTAGVMMEAGASLERYSLGTNQAAVVPCWRSCSAW